MKKIAFLLVIAFMLQSCFSMRPVAVESELKRTHIGRSSTDDIMASLGTPSEQIKESLGEAWLYHTTHLNYGTRTTRYSFDENGIVRNITSDDIVQRKRFNGGGTAVCVLLVVGSVIAIPIILLKNAINY